jgi:hypothetical protein
LPDHKLEVIFDLSWGAVAAFYMAALAYGTWLVGYTLVAVGLSGSALLLGWWLASARRSSQSDLALWMNVQFSLLVMLVLLFGTDVGPFGIISAFFLLNLSIWLIGKVIDARHERSTLFDRAPLKRQMEQLLENRDFSIPVWVTTAELRTIWKPDPGWFYIPGGDPGTGDWSPSTEQRWIPRYHPLAERSQNDRIALCLASAALPYGFVEPVRDGDCLLHDGGIVDNVPVFPMIRRARRLFVLLLDMGAANLDAKEREDRLLKKNGASKDGWTELNYLLRAATLAIPTAADHSPDQKPQVRKFAPDRWPEIVAFYPQKMPSVGGWGPLNGTLNFHPEYAKAAIQQGLEETRVRLHALEERGAI